MERLIVVARFAPEARERVEALLAAGPPFDLVEAGIDRHAVHLSTREAVFVFEGSDVEWEVEELADDFFHPELQEALGEWRLLVEEEPRIAREVFSWERGDGEGRTAPPGATRVADLMCTDIVVVAPEDTVGEAVEKLAAADAGRPALVVDYGRLIGVLSAADVLRAVADRVHPSDARVRTWMTAEPPSVSVDASPEEAAERLVEGNLHHLPVVDGTRAVGIVSLHAIVAGRRRSTVG